MPHKQRHRGARPEDDKLFNKRTQPILQEAVYDYSFLLTRGYAEDALFKLVGDRYQLQKRQRLAVMRCACSDQSLEKRQQRHTGFDQAGEPLLIDGFNLLITIESALSGGFIFEGRDGCLRDISSIHASYKRVEETLPSLKIVGEYLKQQPTHQVLWYLDKPVSNSGRLKQYIETIAHEYNWNWQVELKHSPDYELKRSEGPVVTTDGVILDYCQNWMNLTRWIIEKKVPKFNKFTLKPES